MKNKLFGGKHSRGRIFSVITAAVIILLLMLNLLLNTLSVFGNAYIDLTPEGLYTVRPMMVEACSDIFLEEDGTPKEKGLKITFCTDPDYLIANTYTRPVYYMARALEGIFPNFKVECVNVSLNPTAVAEYKTTSLSAISETDVIISYGDREETASADRYRIASAESFWQIGSEKVYSFDGEYKLASIMLSLTLINQPKAYFVTDHGETYYDKANPESEMSTRAAELYNLLTERGLSVETVSLSKLIADADAHNKAHPENPVKPKIPDDCALLIINNPTRDFVSDSERYDEFSYVSETELLDRYMTSTKGAVMVAKDYKLALPELEDFLFSWGMELGDTLVKDSESYIEKDGTEDGTVIVGEYNTVEESYAYSIYGEFAALSSSPRTVISDTGYIRCSFEDSEERGESGSSSISRIFAPFLYTSPAAHDYAKNSITGEYVDRASKDPSQKTVAAICGRQVKDTSSGENTFSYLFCASSGEFFSNELLGNASFANYDVVSAAVQSISRLESFADMELGGTSYNNYTGFGGKMLVDTEIPTKETPVYKWGEDGKTTVVKTLYPLTAPWLIVCTVVAAIVPVAVATLGIIVFIRRKYL